MPLLQFTLCTYIFKMFILPDDNINFDLKSFKIYYSLIHYIFVSMFKKPATILNDVTKQNN